MILPGISGSFILLMLGLYDTILDAISERDIGTIVVFGKLGIRAGAGMKRGSIVAMQGAEPLPTFSYAFTYHPNYLRSYLLHLRENGMAVEESQIGGLYQRWSGDSVELNRGELLIHQA